VLLLAAFCLFFYVATATAIGSRLVWVGARHGRRPELLLGSGTLLVATIALPLSIASGFGGPAGGVEVPLWAGSEFVTQIGIVCLYAFTQQVFRPGVAWARALIALVAIVLPVCLALATMNLASAGRDVLSVVATGQWLLFCQFGYMGAFVWAALEGLAHWRSARKRMAIGLVDPVVANRFLLFAIYGLCCTVIGFANVTAIVLERNIATSLVVVIPSAIFSVASSAAMFLAIFPPGWYVARVRGVHAVVLAR
jgi:hypothetical protein